MNPVIRQALMKSVSWGVLSRAEPWKTATMFAGISIVTQKPCDPSQDLDDAAKNALWLAEPNREGANREQLGTPAKPIDGAEPRADGVLQVG